MRPATLLLVTLLLAGCLKEGAREARLAPEGCARLDVEPDLVAISPGERAVFTARLTNVCKAAFDIQRSSGCEQDGLDARVLRGGEPWMATGGAAVDMLPCTADMGPLVEVAPGRHVEREFAWNGTFWRQSCMDEECPGPEPAAPGTYALAISLAMPDQTASVTANVHVR